MLTIIKFVIKIIIESVLLIISLFTGLVIGLFAGLIIGYTAWSRGVDKFNNIVSIKGNENESL